MLQNLQFLGTISHYRAFSEGHGWFHLGAINRASSDKWFPCWERYLESNNCYDPVLSNSFSKQKVWYSFSMDRSMFNCRFAWFARMEEFQELRRELLSQVQNTYGNKFWRIAMMNFLTCAKWQASYCWFLAQIQRWIEFLALWATYSLTNILSKCLQEAEWTQLMASLENHLIFSRLD